MNKKTHMSCRDIAKQLGVSATLISMRGKVEGWPGAHGNKWKVPCWFVKKLKPIQETDKEEINSDANRLRYANDIIQDILYSPGFIDDSNKFERLRDASMNLSLVIDTIENLKQDQFDKSEILTLSENLRSANGIKEQAKAIIALINEFKISSKITEKIETLINHHEINLATHNQRQPDRRG